MRLVPDRSLRVLEDGHVLVGGSPLTVLRLSAPFDPDRVTSTVLADRLVDTGMAHPEPTTGPFDDGDVTVVIPVFDDPVGLAATLDGCTGTLTVGVRIVVVDDAGPEAAAVADVVTGRPGVELIRRHRNGGPAAARNTGWRAATTPVVVFIDAGCVPEPGWSTTLLHRFADSRVAVAAPRIRAHPRRWRRTGSDGGTPVGGGRTGRPGFLRRLIARYERARSPLDMGPDEGRIAPRTRISYAPSACLAVRREALAAVGGFDESMRVGEDVDLLWRLAGEHRLRYVPTAVVTHDVRTRPRSWAGRRFAYGTSAAPLALRHPGGPVPVSVSGWSAAAWGAAAVGRPVTGAAIAAASVGLLARRLAGLERPVRVAAGLAGTGNLAAGGLLANAVRRAWWPILVPLALVGPRSSRRALVAAFVVPPLVEWRPSTGLDPFTWLVLSTADDVAYALGVWTGCVRSRTIAPLLPDLGAGRIPPP